MRRSYVAWGLAVVLFVPAAAGARSHYEALYQCWRSVEAEDLRFRQAAPFGKLQDDIWFLRQPLKKKRAFGSRVVLFHKGGAHAFDVRFRRPPATLVASVGGKPAFYFTFKRNKGAEVVVDQFTEAERAARDLPLPGKKVQLKAKPATKRDLAELRARIGGQLAAAKQAAETERAWFALEIKKQSAIWRSGQKDWQETLVKDVKHRLGGLLGVTACAELRGLGEKAAPVVAEIREVERLIAGLAKMKGSARAAQEAFAAAVPLYPGARLATEKETRCLGVDGWQADYDVILSFVTEEPIKVADFYNKQLGIGPTKTDRGYKVILNPPSEKNPVGDHIEIFKEEGKNPCTEEPFTVRVSVFRKKG